MAFGRLYGSHSRKLRLPFLHPVLAPRKSLAGFAAVSLTGAAVILGICGLVPPIRNGGPNVSWVSQGGVTQANGGELRGMGAGLLAISVVAGRVS